MTPTDGGRDRGQLLIIIGFLLGTVFVVLALVVNGAVFAENLATRETVDSERSTSFTVGIDDAVVAEYDRTNDNESRKAVHARTMFNDSLRQWTDQRADTAAQEGALFEAAWTTHVGWRLTQLADRSFAPAGDDTATDWTVVEGTENVSALQFDVTRDDLHDGTEGVSTIDDQAFRLNVSNGTTDWELYVFRDPGNSSVVVYQGDPTSFGTFGDLLDDPNSCSRATDRALIEFLTMTIDASSCDALGFEDDLSGEIAIRYENVHNGTGHEQVNGTYTVIVNGSDAIATNASDYPDRFNVSASDPPTATAIVYEVGYNATYERQDVVHERDGRHDPREELY